MFPWCIRTKKPRREGKGIVFSRVLFCRASNRNERGMDFGPCRPERQAPPFAARAKTAAGPCAVVVSFLFFTFLFFTLFSYFTLSNSVYKKGESADRNRVCVDRFTHLHIKAGKYFHSISRGIMPRIRKKRAGRARGNPRRGRFFTAFHSISTGFSHAETRAKTIGLPAKNARFRAFFCKFCAKAPRGVSGPIGDQTSARAFFTAFSAGTAREKDQSRPKRAARCRQNSHSAAGGGERVPDQNGPRRESRPPR